MNELGRDNHIVVYGSSKQGKTSLLLRTLQEDDYVVVQCSTDWTKEKLYSSILKQLDVRVVETTSRSRARTDEFGAEVEGEVSASFIAKIRGKISAKGSDTDEETVTEQSIPIDLGSAGDIIQLLDEVGYTKFIVVEDFHYLTVEVQKAFASDLKTFYERSSTSFIIVGVWLEANRLIVYNGDLAHRLTSIPADSWEEGELAKVVEAGEPLMNARFSAEVVEALVARAQRNVGQLQEALRQMFIARNIYATTDETTTFEDVSEVDSAYAYVAEQLAGRYANSINKFSEGLRDQKLHMYKWIMHAVIAATPAERRAGLKAMDIVRHVQENHPMGSGVYPNNVQSALTNVAKVQNHAEITPIIFDYDLTHKRLTIVDNGFHVYLEGTPREVAMGYLASFANEDIPNSHADSDGTELPEAIPAHEHRTGSAAS
ncbi:AAA family ATPase [Cellulomonas sp. 179-A 9B4 NHS]|uniref:AAA family ATPase n=1 Tax=Cellulomonas sp. 179-A 9B4 NHS TaxID=3142379 RepID=UPI0039A27AC3